MNGGQIVEQVWGPDNAYRFVIREDMEWELYVDGQLMYVGGDLYAVPPQCEECIEDGHLVEMDGVCPHKGLSFVRAAGLV